MIPNPVSCVRRAMAASLRSMFASSRFPEEQYSYPPGDPGLFGPSSVTWKVHADVAMFPGALSALMLQALHPLALAGVVEHSRFREAPLERISRTSSFIAATTYASTEVAERIIAQVRGIHGRVRGVAPDGRPYSAQDPALLRWVHVAEVVSFMRAHQRYALFPARGADLDRYFAETSIVAEKLGATHVPKSRAEARAYLREVRAELVADDQAHEALAFLQRPLAADPVTRAATQLLVQAGFGLLPGWARDIYGIRQPPGLDLTVVRPATHAVLTALRVTLGASPILAEAQRRASAAPVALAGRAAATAPS